MINTKQIIAIAGVLLLMVVIFLQPVKSLTNEEDAADAGAETGASEMFSLESVSEIAKQGLSANLSQSITEVEEKLKTASDDEKLPLYKQLAELWDDVNKPMPTAYVYNEIALHEPTFENWLKTGDMFTDSNQHLSDTVMAPILTSKARAEIGRAS